jgi:hypothetical protein
MSMSISAMTIAAVRLPMPVTLRSSAAASAKGIISRSTSSSSRRSTAVKRSM